MMSNVNVNLTPYLKQWVEAKITSGRYNNISEVIREALRLLEARDELRAAKIRDLRTAITEGENSGEAIPLDIEAIKREGRIRRTTALREIQE
jgi:antitoxin ParD1/3/4